VYNVYYFTPKVNKLGMLPSFAGIIYNMYFKGSLVIFVILTDPTILSPFILIN